MNKDLISRSKLIETIINPLNVNDAAKNDWYEGYYDAKNEDVEIIKAQPPIDAIVNTVEVRPQGKWIDHSMENILWGHNECPFCHKRSNRGAHFCQYCGAALEDSEE